MSPAQATAAMVRSAELRDIGMEQLVSTIYDTLRAEFPDLTSQDLVEIMKADCASKWMDWDASPLGIAVTGNA